MAKNYKGVRSVFIKVKCPEQPADNCTIVYDGPLEGERLKFTKRDLIAFGWSGQTSATLRDDILNAAKRVPFRVEHVQMKNLTKNGDIQYFAAMRDIGRREVPEHQDMNADEINALDDALAAADGDEAPANSADPSNW